MTTQPLYLIAHIVTGEPAFDIAIQLCDHDSDEPCQPNCGLYPDCKGEWWIIPTSGHRAYPYWAIRLEDIDDTHSLKLDGSGISEYTDGPPEPPENWTDHYKYNPHLLETKETIQNAQELLAAIGFDNLQVPPTALGLRSAPIRRRV